MDSLLARVAAIAARSPERIAIVAEDRAIDYGAFWAEACGFARALRARGLRTGDRVAIVLPNRIEAAVACYGSWLAGAIAVPLNAQARTRELDAWLRHCETAHVVYEASHRDAQESVATLPGTVGRWPIDGARGLAQIAARVASDVADDEAAMAGDASTSALASNLDLDLDATASILYTSGTTGAPKGVALSHRNLIANASAVARYLGLRQDDSVLSILAFYYAYGASVLHTHLMVGARVVLAPNLLFPHLLMDTIARERITGFSGVPSTYALLLERVKLSDYDLSSLRYLTQAGGAMSRSLSDRLRAALPGPALYLMYGQTEATSRLTWLPPERLDDKPGSVGIPIDGVVLRIAREDGGDADVDEIGEVWARGANVMRGYWRDPEASAAVLRDGWLRTGDMGRLDADGFLYLSGRRGDMIKTGAHRVHPLDIEDVIAEVPGVGEVAVIGVDDDTLGQAIKAFVVAPGLPPRSENLIKAHCRKRLASYKIPRDIAFVAALPRTASGKVRRAALLELQNAS